MAPHRQSRQIATGAAEMAVALITGGAGFIGSNLADALSADGRVVHVVDDLSNGDPRRLPPEAELHRVDVRDGEALERVVADAAPRTIFHLAAQADVRRAVEEPTHDAGVNIVGTINVLEAARKVGARVVFASTGGAAYGEYEGLPIPTSEEHAPRPLSQYGMSKVAAEGYCLLYERLYGLETAVLRLANVYGPRQDPHGEAGVVAIFCGCVLAGRAPKVFGDGLQTRDYVYVGDVVRAFLAAESGPVGRTVNIGTGAESSVLDLIDGLGIPTPPEFAPARAGELQRSALDASLARSLYDWEPLMSLRAGLQATLASARSAAEHPDRRAPGAFDAALAPPAGRA